MECGAIYALEQVHYDHRGGGRTVLTTVDLISFAILTCEPVFISIIHPVVFMPIKVYLDHIVTSIDEDVYFEKSGSGDNAPYRINSWDGITKNFPPSVFNWEWRRLLRRFRYGSHI